MQLYRITCLIKWNDPQQLTSMVLRPGMIHTLMSLGSVGSAGELMNSTGLEDSNIIITPTLIAHRLWRAERDCHPCLEKMLPYFFASSHHHYSRWITWHLRDMQHLPVTAKDDLLQKPCVPPLRWCSCSECRYVWGEDMHQAREGSRRHEGHFHQS